MATMAEPLAGLADKQAELRSRLGVLDAEREVLNGEMVAALFRPRLDAGEQKRSLSRLAEIEAEAGTIRAALERFEAMHLRAVREDAERRFEAAETERANLARDWSGAVGKLRDALAGVGDAARAVLALADADSDLRSEQYRLNERARLGRPLEGGLPWAVAPDLAANAIAAVDAAVAQARKDGRL